MTANKKDASSANIDLARELPTLWINQSSKLKFDSDYNFSNLNLKDASGVFNFEFLSKNKELVQNDFLKDPPTINFPNLPDLSSFQAFSVDFFNVRLSDESKIDSDIKTFPDFLSLSKNLEEMFDHSSKQKKLGDNFVTVVPPISPTRTKTQIEEKWEGVVESTERQSFIATIKSFKEDSPAAERVEFDFDEIPEADHDLIETGAIFYWYIGRTTDEAGCEVRTSEIRFRRLPAWSASEQEKAKKAEEKFGKLLSPKKKSKSA